MTSNDDLIVFGYGSLLWKFPYPFYKSQHARVYGYVRRFWQSSPEHRGTENDLGRVVTLIPSTTSKQVYVDGTIFYVAAKDAKYVLEELYEREKAGYDHVIVKAVISEENNTLTTIEANTFFANETNYYWKGRNYIGTDVEDALADYDAAKIIAFSKGKSGTNIDYLLSLISILRKRNIQDMYLETLLMHVFNIRSSAGYKVPDIPNLTEPIFIS